MFLLDPDDSRGETGKPGEVIRGSGDGSPPAGSRGRAPGGRLGGKAPGNGGLGAEPPESEQVLMIIKTFLSGIFLIKSGIYSIIRTLTSALIFSRQLSK